MKECYYDWAMIFVIAMCFLAAIMLVGGPGFKLYNDTTVLNSCNPAGKQMTAFTVTKGETP